MNENAFRETLINTLRFDGKFKDMKATLMPLISRCRINSVPQWGFAVRSGQHWEDVEVRVPVPLIDEANNQSNSIEKLVGYVYEESEEYALRNVLIRPMIIATPVDELIQNDVVFSEIQDTLIQGIRDAKYLIWVAVAWFSNDVFYNELLRKKQEGVNIRVIVSDEDSNRELLPKLKSEFDTVVVPHSGYWQTNRMHNKFCIVDMDYVMHGSYNWTKAANYNGETLATAIDREFVKKFADEFQRLYVENK